MNFLVGLQKKFTPPIVGWRHDFQHNDTQHNDIQHNDTQHNDTYHKGIMWDTQHK